MKKPTKADKERVAKYAADMRPLLGLTQWTFNFTFADDDKEGVAAEITSQPEYKRAFITIFPCFWQDTKKDQREIIVHELCHILTDPLYFRAFDLLRGKLVTDRELDFEREQLTETIAVIINQLT